MSAPTFSRLLAQEWRLFAANRANLVILAVLALLLGFAVVNGVRRVADTRLAQREAVTSSNEGWTKARAAFVELADGRREKQEFEDPSRADLVVLRDRNAIAMAPAPLAVLSVGPSREGHDLIAFGLGSRHRATPGSRENPAIRLDGPLDPAFIVAWLVPLVLLVLAYDVLSRDREQQITPMLAAQGRTLRSIVVARLTVCFIAVFLITGGVGAAGVLASSEGQMARVMPDLITWLVALAACIAFWLALAGWVNAGARSSATAGVSLLGLWVASAVLVPVIASQVLSRDAATSDRLESVLGRRALDSDLTERAAEVTTTYYAEDARRRPQRGEFSEYERYFVENYYPRQVMIDRLFAPVAQHVEQRRARQAQRQRLASMASPSLALKVVTDDLAGYAPERRQRFEAAATRFQSQWRTFFDVKFAARIPLALDDYDHAPRFTYRDEDGGDRLRRALLPLSGLLLASLVAAAVAFARLRRARP